MDPPTPPPPATVMPLKISWPQLGRPPRHLFSVVAVTDNFAQSAFDPTHEYATDRNTACYFGGPLHLCLQSPAPTFVEDIVSYFGVRREAVIIYMMVGKARLL